MTDFELYPLKIESRFECVFSRMILKFLDKNYTMQFCLNDNRFN